MLNSKTCLIVDDDQTMQSLGAEGMSHYGYLTFTASNGEEAFSICKEWLIDVVLLDMLMLPVGGHEFVRKIRENMSPEQQPKIIACTTLDRDECIAMLQGHPVDAIYTKPYNYEDVVRLIDELDAK